MTERERIINEIEKFYEMFSDEKNKKEEEILLNFFHSIPDEILKGRPFILSQTIRRLMEGYPLNALEDKEEDWVQYPESATGSGFISYRHVRRSSLIRYKDSEDQNFIYKDFARYKFIQIKNENNINLIDRHILETFLDVEFPIIFPYLPYDQIRVYWMWEDEANGKIKLLKIKVPSGLLIEKNQIINLKNNTFQKFL